MKPMNISQYTGTINRYLKNDYVTFNPILRVP